MQTAEKKRRDIEEQETAGPAKTQANQMAASLGPLRIRESDRHAIESAVKEEGGQNTATKASRIRFEQDTAEGKASTQVLYGQSW